MPTVQTNGIDTFYEAYGEEPRVSSFTGRPAIIDCGQNKLNHSQRSTG